MPGSFVVDNEVLQHAKDLANIPKQYKVIPVVIFKAIVCAA